ncbi:hypothetical protein EBU94_05560 [bacterium]|nr:hypothetical protein [bacterium]
MAYIRKTSDLYVSPELHEVLEQIKPNSEVAKLLFKPRVPHEILVENHVNYISISKDDPTKISYLTSDKIQKFESGEWPMDEIWTSSRRIKIKPGAFVKKLFKDISEVEIEKFSSLYRSVQTTGGFTFKVVKGSEILHYYHYNTYSKQDSSLGSSCMKHSSCQDWLSIYGDNQDSIQMLVMLDTNNQLLGRALLWNNCFVREKSDLIQGVKIMDRIYTVNDENWTFHFKKWADDNGYFYKKEQKWNNTLFFESKGEEKFMEIDIQLNKTNYRRFPYLDTFKFLNRQTNTLHNYIPTEGDIITLSSADGYHQSKDCLCMDGLTKLFHWKHDLVLVEYRGFLTHPDNVHYSSSNDCYILREDAVYDPKKRDYVFREDFLKNVEQIGATWGPSQEPKSDVVEERFSQGEHI